MRYEPLKVANITITVYWCETLCSFVDGYQRYEVTGWLHFPVSGGTNFTRNIATYLPFYMVSYPKIL